MRTPSQQRGIGLMGLIFVIAVVVITAMVALKLVPIYDEYMGILRSVEQVRESPEFNSMSPKVFQSEMSSKLYFNGVDKNINGENFFDHFSYERTADGPVISIHYEREAHLIQNVYFLVKFETPAGEPVGE